MILPHIIENLITMFGIIMFMVILSRDTELEEIKSLGNWVYICGRRKTGKTFFVKNFTDYDMYFFINRDGTAFTEDGRRISYETFFELVRENIGTKRIVIDEMHRLPDEFFDYLHSTGKKGRIIAVSSTLWLSQKLLGSGSPLLGLFSLYIFGLADQCDVLSSLKTASPVERLESALYLREPMLAGDFESDIVEFLSNYLHSNRLTLQEITGEIFSEERRNISAVYEGILRAIADGKGKSTEISSYLFSRKLIPKDNPGLIQRYLDVLVKIGFIEKIETERRSFHYIHVSPLFRLHFYLDEKYGYTELDIPKKYIEEVVRNLLPRDVEQFMADMFSRKLGLKKIKINNPEIDIALKRFDRIVLVGEVKWRKKVSKTDVLKAEEKLSSFECERILIVPDKREIDCHGDMKILDARDILSLCEGNMQLNI